MGQVARVEDLGRGAGQLAAARGDAAVLDGDVADVVEAAGGADPEAAEGAEQEDTAPGDGATTPYRLRYCRGWMRGFLVFLCFVVVLVRMLLVLLSTTESCWRR